MVNAILIVEDDADIREDLADILRDEGYDVTTAANGRDARDRLKASEDRPDLILLDLMMPVMDGWQFRTEQLKDAALAEIPVVILSGAGDVRREAAALGASGYVTKPFKIGALLGVIHQAPPGASGSGRAPGSRRDRSSSSNKSLGSCQGPPVFGAVYVEAPADPSVGAS